MHGRPGLLRASPESSLARGNRQEALLELREGALFNLAHALSTDAVLLPECLKAMHVLAEAARGQDFTIARIQAGQSLFKKALSEGVLLFCFKQGFGRRLAGRDAVQPQAARLFIAGFCKGGVQRPVARVQALLISCTRLSSTPSVCAISAVCAESWSSTAPICDAAAQAKNKSLCARRLSQS